MYALISATVLTIYYFALLKLILAGSSGSDSRAIKELHLNGNLYYVKYFSKHLLDIESFLLDFEQEIPGFILGLKR